MDMSTRYVANIRVEEVGLTDDHLWVKGEGLLQPCWTARARLLDVPFDGVLCVWRERVTSLEHRWRDNWWQVTVFGEPLPDNIFSGDEMEVWW